MWTAWGVVVEGKVGDRTFPANITAPCTHHRNPHPITSPILTSHPPSHCTTATQISSVRCPSSIRTHSPCHSHHPPPRPFATTTTNSPHAHPMPIPNAATGDRPCHKLCCHHSLTCPLCYSCAGSDRTQLLLLTMQPSASRARRLRWRQIDPRARNVNCRYTRDIACIVATPTHPLTPLESPVSVYVGVLFSL